MGIAPEVDGESRLFDPYLLVTDTYCLCHFRGGLDRVRHVGLLGNGYVRCQNALGPKEAFLVLGNSCICRTSSDTNRALDSVEG